MFNSAICGAGYNYNTDVHIWELVKKEENAQQSQNGETASNQGGERSDNTGSGAANPNAGGGNGGPGAPKRKPKKSERESVEYVCSSINSFLSENSINRLIVRKL